MMGVGKNILLKKQLEQQAKLLAEEQDEKKLVVSILLTCFSLLRVAEETLPTTLSDADFNSVYLEYVGIANKVKNFCKENESRFDGDQCIPLNELLNNLHSLEQAKKNAEEKLAELKNQIETEQSSFDQLKENLESKQKQYNSLIMHKSSLSDKLSDIQSQILNLEKEIVSVNYKIKKFEPDVERLVKEANTAKNVYSEMLAYYIELERIQSAMNEDGYIDADSFAQRLQNMNEQGNKLMSQYDEILKCITEDIESLQRKIEAKRKVNVVG